VNAFLVVLPIALALIAIVLLLVSNRQRRLSGLPGLRVVYSDTGQWRELNKPLYDPLAGLTGKPDYIVELEGCWIPVEVKSSWAPELPRPAHLLQLAAYCLLVQRASRKRAPYGIIHYRNRDFEVPYSQQLEQDLLRTLAEIRKCERGELARSHTESHRCRGCGYRHLCDQRL
jgi:CRISPR-associated exonuclease Cas4